MSYARWGCDGSELYVYLDVTRGYTCMRCPLLTNAHDYCTPHATSMVHHLEAHQLAGHAVPQSAIESVRAEAE